MAIFANGKRGPSVIKEGAWVYLKIRPHRQAFMPTRLHSKLLARYYSSFQVGPVAFNLPLPKTAHIHPTFHVSQLKLEVETQQVERELPEDLQGGPGAIQLHGEPVPQVLIEWYKGGLGAVKWEDEAMMRDQFPDFHLEDRVVQRPAGNDRTLRDMKGGREL